MKTLALIAVIVVAAAVALVPFTATAAPCDLPVLRAVTSRRLARRAAFERAKRLKAERLEAIARKYQTRSSELAGEAPAHSAPAVQRVDSSRIGGICWPPGVTPATARRCTCDCP